VDSIRSCHCPRITKFVIASILGFFGSGWILNPGLSQTITSKSYFVQTPGTYDVTILTDALDKAAFDPYRMKSGNRVLEFDKGAIVVLLSASELQQKGIPVNYSQALDSIPVDIAPRQFVVDKFGNIREYIDYIEKE